MQFEEPGGTCSRWVEAGDLAFLMHIEAANDYEDYIRGVEIKITD